jgi:hypothetical protein
MPREPHKEGRDYRRAEDDPERCSRQLTARWHLRELAGDTFELAFDQGEIGTSLIDLPQRELALIWHAHVFAENSCRIVNSGRQLGGWPAIARHGGFSLAGCARVSY